MVLARCNGTENVCSCTCYVSLRAGFSCAGAGFSGGGAQAERPRRPNAVAAVVAATAAARGHVELAPVPEQATVTAVRRRLARPTGPNLGGSKTGHLNDVASLFEYAENVIEPAFQYLNGHLTGRDSGQMGRMHASRFFDPLSTTAPSETAVDD
jgi:hypothetical protein